MKDLRGSTLKEIEEIFNKLKLPRYKAKEVFRQVHGRLKPDISQLTVLRLEEREKLKEYFFLDESAPLKTQEDGETEKAAFRLKDGNGIEAVLMQYEPNNCWEGERNTVCVSSQSGCLVGCAFCATGKMGFRRNLTVGEILSQVYFFAGKHKISNIVFMGMGEPFLNYGNVMKAIGILNAELGQNIAKRKIVISTIGIIPGIEKFTHEPGQIRLAWSLVAPFDHLRRELINLKNLPSISSIILAMRNYQQKTKRRISIEYVVLRAVNDGSEEVKALIRIARQIDSHVNLIPYNPVAGLPFKNGNLPRVHSSLKKAGINVTVRKSLGIEIDAACGQLCIKNAA